MSTTPQPPPSQHGTPTRILDAAERLVQARGFNAFSYGDVAGELKITTAALHYHYPRKAELGTALVSRYSASFASRLSAMDDAGASIRSKLDGYVAIYAEELSHGGMCLGGMLAAEYTTLSADMQAAIRDFFDRNEAWLATVLEQGRTEGCVQFAGCGGDTARMIISGLQGAMLLSMPYGDVKRFTAVAKCLLYGLYRPARIS
ncbi:MAG TPA: TetR/AcrR family transcriptional regulator [Streptosporangiaceae bacterium]|nr:TetR/AcrR family transcriptional regulator [Streptosporangiaceae bacterium]